MNIYLDNAASAPMDKEVLTAMLPYFCDTIGNPSSIHLHGRVLRTAIEQSRKTIASLLGAVPAEIFFTGGGTEADNAIIYGVVEKYQITHIVSTTIEHHAVTHTIEDLVKKGKVSATWLSVDSKGNIDLAELAAVLEKSPRTLVSLMHANNEIGTMIDLVAVGEVCKKYDALFHSDTVQTMGHFSFDLYNTNVHYITGAAHKFYGPKGTGFMYVKSGFTIPALIRGGSQERNMRAGTENVAGIVGMAYALEKCYKTLAEKTEKLWALKNYMREQLALHIPTVHFNGEISPEKSIPTVLNVAFDCGEEDAMLIFYLDIKGISASGGSACTSGSDIGSHVLAALGLPPTLGRNAVRFSFGVQNTQAEIDVVVENLKEILKIGVGNA